MRIIAINALKYPNYVIIKYCFFFRAANMLLQIALPLLLTVFAAAQFPGGRFLETPVPHLCAQSEYIQLGMQRYRFLHT